MCGINGIFAYRDVAPPVEKAELLRVRDAMVKRGPDGAGLWISPDRRVGLGHRRLSIIDLSDNGAQPMATAEGRLQITFNGEIYNYKALRKELEQKGYFFRTQSDTEVLLHLYADRGAEMVHALRGMYAFGIWDERDKTLFLARDPFGVKPLYYADDCKTLRFASQVKALLRSDALDLASEPAGAAGFFLWGFVPEPFTLYRGIDVLPAGTHLTLKSGDVPRITAHFSVRDELLRAQEQPHLFTSHHRGALAASLRDTIHHHLVSDVPVGVFLSSGVDSNLVAGIAAEQSNIALRTLTLAFEEYRGTLQDEAPLAEKSAATLGAQHETRWIRRGDFEEEFKAIMAAMDQPTTDGVNTWFVCREAANAGLKVALSGLGGDELFGGYPSFRDVPRLARWLRPASKAPRVGRLARRALAQSLSVFTSPKYAGLLEYGGSVEGAYLLRRALFMPWEIDSVLDPATVRTGLERLETLPILSNAIRGVNDDYARVATLELAWYMRNQLLRDADWAGMSHSVEVRVPFVDAALFRTLAPWLVSGSAPRKTDAASALRHPLSPEILNRSKSGFAVPVRDWLKPQGDGRPIGRGLRNWARHIYDRFNEPSQIHASTRAAGGDPVPSGARERILVFRIGQLGDTVVSVPALWAVRQRFPRAHITLLCDRQPDSRFVVAADLLRGTELIDGFKTYNADGSGSGGLRWSWHMLMLLSWLRGKHFDRLIYLAPSARSADQLARDSRFFAAAGIREMIGLHSRSQLLGGTTDHAATNPVSEADLILSHLAADGIPTPPAGEGRMDLQIGGYEEKEVRRWLSGLSPDGARRWIGVGPGSKMPAKRWPMERFAESVSTLIADHDLWPVVFGGPEDRAHGESLLSGWRRGYNAAGVLGLRPAAAALRRCTLFLGNDTGTMHLAAAVGTPSVAIFSARDLPGRWNPYGHGHIALRTQIDCEGCGLVECVARKNECLMRIATASVVDECERMVARAN